MQLEISRSFEYAWSSKVVKVLQPIRATTAIAILELNFNNTIT